MIISEERQSHLAQIVNDGVWEDDLLDFSDDDIAYRATKMAIMSFVKEIEEMDRGAREKVASLKRGVIEGSPEWDILYKKYYEEERNRRGKG